MNISWQRLLIILGLVIVPFYELFLRALPFVVINAPDSRAPKEIIALVFALAIGLLAVFEGSIKPFRNKFLLLIPLYLLFNLIMSPHIDLVINNVESGDFYFWKPFAEILCFTFMIIAIASIELPVDNILKTMVICGTVMSGYVVLQQFGMDQFWLAKGFSSDPAIGGKFISVHAHNIGGNLGQCTIVASFIVMMVPLAIYLRKWWMAILMVVACFLTQTMAVILALGLMGVFLLFYFNRRIAFLNFSVFVILIVSVFLIFGSHNNRVKIINRMEGRWDVWKETASDIKYGQLPTGKNYSFTGVGLGRFGFVFPAKHGSNFQQAHNDILEFTYNCGLIGCFLLLAGIYVMANKIILFDMPILHFSILLSFLTIFFCSLASFPFQLGAHQFYSAVLVGLLNNDGIIRRIT